MKKADVRQEIDKLLELMREEQKLRIEILSLEMLGPQAVVRKNAERHDAILVEIEELRQARMMPIFRNFARVIKKRAPNKSQPPASESPDSSESPESSDSPKSSDSPES